MQRRATRFVPSLGAFFFLFPVSGERREREREKRVIAGFIARRVLAAVRIGLWRLLNFDVTKSLARDRARPSSSVACMLKPFRIMIYMLEEELLRKLSFRIFLFFFLEDLENSYYGGIKRRY